MSIQILFSKEDPLGTESSVQRLFWHTDYIKIVAEPQIAHGVVTRT